MPTWTSKIYLVGATAEDLIPMLETPYAAEALLQERLALYPDLLPGDQIDPENPRRWLLVTREMPVPGVAEGAGRWSLDHLFLDQDAIPTFVECKRSDDTRSRREVVAQMLDYAANGSEYWSITKIRQAAAETAGQSDAPGTPSSKLDVRVRELLQITDADDTDDTDGSRLDAFWEQAEQNLRSGKVRLIFVADETSRDLRRLVEFLNNKLADVEVLAVEIKQFVAEHHTAVVSRVVGLTEAAKSGKSGGGSIKADVLNLATFLARCSPDLADLFRAIYETSAARGYSFNWGTVRFSIRARASGQIFSFAYCYPGKDQGKLEIYFDSSTPIPAETVANIRQQLLSTGLFTASSSAQYTIAAIATQANAPRLREAFIMVADEIDRFIHEGSASEALSATHVTPA